MRDLNALNRIPYTLLRHLTLKPTKIILQTQYFFVIYIHNLKLKGINTMKKYQVNIIKEYISSALISDEPEIYLQEAIENLFQYLTVEDRENELDALFETEITLPIKDRL